MRQQRKHYKSRPARADRTADERSSSDVESRSAKQREITEQVLKITGDVLADIDDALKEALGADEKNADELAD